MPPVLPLSSSQDMDKVQKSKDHVVIFPFLAKGHTIPLIHLATALSARCGLRITFVTTPANAPFIRHSLPADRHPDVRLIILPFPSCPPLPSGCESTDMLPSFDLYPLFLGATTLLRQPFDAVLNQLVRSSSPPLCLVSDFFFGWTLPICRRLHLPRLVFHGMSAFAMTLCKSIWVHLPELDVDCGRPFHVPGTPPTLLVTKGEVPDSVLRSTDPNDPGTRFVSELGDSDISSWGVVVNSFADIEGEYAALFESFYKDGARAWLVGPLCLFADNSVAESDNECIRWLDQQDRGSVVYVSFGTQAQLPDEQLDEVAHGLAESGCRFIWAVRSDTWAPPEGLELSGKIVKWAPQRAALDHAATRGFVSHCGWNSVLEAVSAGVPILAWPMIAEQHLNAKHVVDELGFGLSLGPRAAGEMVGREEVSRGLRELMGDGEKGRRARERAVELRKKAKAAVEEGGSSHERLAELIDELRKVQREREEAVSSERGEIKKEEALSLDTVLQRELREGIQIA